MPEPTLLSFADHGTLGPVLSPDALAAEELLLKFAQAGVDVDVLAAQLQEAGAAAFVKSWDELLTVLDAKAKAQLIS
jgi:transaldolase